MNQEAKINIAITYNIINDLVKNLKQITQSKKENKEQKQDIKILRLATHQKAKETKEHIIKLEKIEQKEQEQLIKKLDQIIKKTRQLKRVKDITKQLKNLDQKVKIKQSKNRSIIKKMLLFLGTALLFFSTASSGYLLYKDHQKTEQINKIIKEQGQRNREIKEAIATAKTEARKTSITYNNLLSLYREQEGKEHTKKARNIYRRLAQASRDNKQAHKKISLLKTYL